MVTEQQKIKVMNSMIDMPKHKLLYILPRKDYVAGMWDHLKRYGIEFSKENHELLVEQVQTKIEGTSEIEREWTEPEYDNFVMYSEEILA